MIDILKNICENLNINLVYTNNKFSILSCGINNGRLIMRVHNLFKDCKADIAEAIVSYYTKTENREENLKIIRAYADEKFDTKKYKITPPDGEFFNIVLKTLNSAENHDHVNENMVELNISYMTKKDFYGEEQKIKKNETIKVDEDDLVEVNIIVDPFNT